ncbi:hypothetical protein QJS66_16695 [Kocuria rhizophila]|nr:hypothetical protein QJS66_16695 [Kocuria rhizophila]
MGPDVAHPEAGRAVRVPVAGCGIAAAMIDLFIFTWACSSTATTSPRARSLS